MVMTTIIECTVYMYIVNIGTFTCIDLDPIFRLIDDNV